MKSIFILLALFFMHTQSKAQITSDALLFSENHQTVTARSMALGNALGALGGDMSTANLNPAGIAIYRRMELGISLGGLFDNTKTDFLSNQTKDRLSQMTFGNIGLVIASPLRRSRTKWKAVNVGLTFNRIANYARNFTYQGASTGSRIQSFAENSAGISSENLDPYEGWLAYNAYLMDSVSGGYTPNGGVSDSSYTNKYENIRRTGGVNELGFTVGGNYDNKLYIAATLGVDFMEMNEDHLYQETSDSLDFIALDFTENRNVKGTGINLKIGMIYRINKLVRIGLAVHTPTAYRLVDSYNSGLYGEIIYDSLLQATNYAMEDADPLVLQHDLVTPWVFMGSVGIVIPKRGFIGLDVEYSDYSWASFALLENERTVANNKFINDLNDRVVAGYKGVLKARIGAEMAFGLARLRLGYQFQTSPYEESIAGVTDMRHDISAGLGLRWKHFYLDFGYSHTLKDFEYSPYTSSSTIQRVTGASQTGHAMLSIGALIFRDKDES
ncbi:MAG: Outer membrane protein transport protein (OMPP1/FadL/TodX) [uncultured Aureispira sp.]|uniref:Outer membrane protein transport protein (OMPP1/FadL/TodX) n=1 Tax=uncultured Aureispira sp. TaxID=1331704 RepID=A0A6S6SA05_9BACT|nr:MAG: Outer membrane protein transport protein (OMPP1/FadL/TodX) [uncultured Aureispira sp.]